MERNSKKIRAHGLGLINTGQDLGLVNECSDGFFRTGRNGVVSILRTGDVKVEFISFRDRTIAYVNSNMGYPTIGFSSGNIIGSGIRDLCNYFCDSFDEIKNIILEG